MICAVGLLGAFALSAGPVGAGPHRGGKRFCSKTASLQLGACLAEITDDNLIGKATCLNEPDPDAASECRADVGQEHREGRTSCVEQFRARRALCHELGEERYDPSFDPADFQTVFDDRNRYLPIAVRNFWQYESEEEAVTVRVLDQTKDIEGVTCIVVRDMVEVDGRIVEDTNDWFGQRLDGTIDYCGEEAKDYEFFDGDRPTLPELVEIEGSFKAGRDGAKPGTLFPGSPEVGRKYRQEWSLSNAEDVAEVVSTDYGYGRDARFDPLVPQALVELMCDADCVVTAETTPIEPDALEYKFYARGVGRFLEVTPDGDASVLVGCNTGPRCDLLPVEGDEGQ